MTHSRPSGARSQHYSGSVPKLGQWVGGLRRPLLLRGAVPELRVGSEPLASQPIATLERAAGHGY